MLLAPQAAGREGTIAGTMTFNGRAIAATHVYASAQPGFFDPDREDIHVLFSDRALSDAARDDTFELSRLAREERAHIIEVVIDAGGQPIAGSIYAPEVQGMISVAGMHVFTRDVFESRRIAGRLAVSDPRTFMGLTWAYSVTFSAPIPRPPTPAELADMVASPPAVAAARYLAALKDGRTASWIGMLTATAAGRFQGSAGQGAFDRLRREMPIDSRVISVQPQTDGSVIVDVEGHDAGIVIAHPLRLVMEQGAWKVDATP